MTADAGLAALRKPFPAAVIGKLPKGGTFLDYVGHAAVTDRLLTVDPAWTWEPVAFGEDGLPVYDKAGGLWIRLTVCGVTRLGYGDGPDPKQRIGDALRNAAMRFGVALDLWTKNELESTDPNGGDAAQRPAAAPKPVRSPAQQAKAELWTYAQTIGYTEPAKLAEAFAGWSSGLELAAAPAEDVVAFLAFLRSEQAA